MLWFLFCLFKTRSVVILTLNQSSIAQSHRSSLSYPSIFLHYLFALWFFFSSSPSLFLRFSLSFRFPVSCLFFSAFFVSVSVSVSVTLPSLFPSLCLFPFPFLFLHNISSISFNRLNFSLFTVKAVLPKKFAFPCFFNCLFDSLFCFLLVLFFFSWHIHTVGLIIPHECLNPYLYRYLLSDFVLLYRLLSLTFVIIRISVLSLRLIYLVFFCSSEYELITLLVIILICWVVFMMRPQTSYFFNKKLQVNPHYLITLKTLDSFSWVWHLW